MPLFNAANMDLTVRTLKGFQLVQCEFMQHFDHRILKEWSKAMSQRRTFEQNDAIEFCESVAAKWVAYKQRNRIARSLEELAQRSNDEPEGESLGVLAVKASWYAGNALAFCEFRRTWSNNIVFDFLAVRPDLLGQTPRPISGLGTSLLCHLAHVARALNANTVWAETTSTSVHFYRKALGRTDFQDLLQVGGEEFYRCFGKKKRLKRI
jgi:N-acetylglutamate synthase-like GNAT family acetyltransferase